MGIFNLFGKKDVSTELTKGAPYRLATELVPYKLYAKRKSSSTLKIRLRNLTNEVLLTSVAAELPKPLAFEATGLTKQREVRIGDLAPNEEKEVQFEVFTTPGSDPGDYTLSLTAMAHYRDYGRIINAVRKRVMIGVV